MAVMMKTVEIALKSDHGICVKDLISVLQRANPESKVLIEYEDYDEDKGPIPGYITLKEVSIEDKDVILKDGSFEPW